MKKINLFVILAAFFIGITPVFADSDLPFAKKVATGNLITLDKAFFRLSKADGGDAEDLDIAIGKSIKIKPKNFLIALKKNRAKVERLDLLVTNLGEHYVDQKNENKIVELKARIKALKSVPDKSLKTTANECIGELEKKIESFLIPK